MQTGFNAGWVVDYNPETRIYTVNLDGLGDRQARRLHSGVDRPFPKNTRVVCAKADNLAWIIMGELEMPSPRAGENRPKTTDEAAAEFVNNLAELAAGEPALDTPQYRSSGDDIHFAGDVSLENRTEDPVSRSKIKIYSFGAVLTFASNFCFQLFNKKDNKILINARSIITRTIGYIKSITFNSKTNRTTLYERTQSNFLETNPAGQPAPKIDRETIEGFIPITGTRAKYGSQLIRKPKVERGRRDKFGDHRVEERDNLTNSYRERQDSVNYNIDGTEKSRKTEIYKEEGRIVSGSGSVSYGSRVIYRDWLIIEINNETNSVRIEDLKRSQKIEMSSSGVFIKGNNVSIDGDMIKLSASTAIELNTPALLGTNLTTALFETPVGTPMLQLDSAGGGYFDLSPYKGIILDGYSKLVSLNTVSKSFGAGLRGLFGKFRSKIGMLKGLLGSVKSAAQSMLGDKLSILGEVTSGLTSSLGGLTGGLGGLTGGLGGLTGGITPPDLSSITPPDLSGITPPDLSGITPPDLSGITPPNLSGVTPPNVNLPLP